MENNFFCETAQAFITSACGMNCLRCSLKNQFYLDMAPKTFERIVMVLPRLGVKRLELFANDPMRHPQISKFVDIMNRAEPELKFAILTVGASPKDPNVALQFFQILNKIDPAKISFVFSVDYKEKTADEILLAGERHPEYPAAFKAKVFWELAPELIARGISFRTNSVISRYNTGEVSAILEQVISLGGLVSFCHAQHTPLSFHSVFARKELGHELEEKLRTILVSVKFLSDTEIENIVLNVKNIAKGSPEFFNRFRGNNPLDAEISEDILANMRSDLLRLKKQFKSLILPDENFIASLGAIGFGCLELLKVGKFSLKIGTEGEMIFCCDLYDPLTRSYKWEDMYDPEIRWSFLRMVRTNPYIWFCLLFPCSWSVNYVKYASRKEEVCALI